MGDSPEQICASPPADDNPTTQKPVINSPGIPVMVRMCQLDQQGAAEYREHTTAEEECLEPLNSTQRQQVHLNHFSGGNQVTCVHY